MTTEQDTGRDDARAEGHDASGGMAAAATLHCLTGCSIGEIGGLLISAAAGLAAIASIPISIGLSFVFGYTLSSLPLLAAGLPAKRVFQLVLAADTLSILTMEAVDNLFVAIVPGALNAGLGDALFWWSTLLSLVVAYGAAFPVNLWLLRRGQGHAITHGADAGDARPRSIPVPNTIGLACVLTAFMLGGLLAAAGG